MSFTRPRLSVASAALAIAALALAAAALAAPPAALAVYDTGPEAAAAAQVGGQAADDGPEANLPYLFAVFIITWRLFFAFAAYVSLPRRAMEREIEALRASMEDSDGQPEGERD